MDSNSVKEFIDSVAKSFGFADARQAFNILTDKDFRHETKGNYISAVHVVYKESPDSPASHMALFVHDLLIDPAGGLTFYSLVPASGDQYKEHFDQLIEICATIQTAEQLLDYVKNPEKLGVPVQREFHNVLTYSSSMAGVVNYTRDSVTDEVAVCAPFTFMPVIDRLLDKKSKPEKGGDGTVTTLTPRPNK